MLTQSFDVFQRKFIYKEKRGTVSKKEFKNVNHKINYETLSRKVYDSFILKFSY